MLRDVTEPMRAQQEAERRRADLIQAQKLTALGTLVAGVAHEVNNPNTVIRLNLAALQRRLAALPRPAGEAADGRGELDALIAEIRDASDRIDSLVASLKAFTRPADPSMTEPVSLSAVIRNAVDLLRHPIAKSRCRLRLDLAEPLPPVIGNAQKLTQVLVNLIQNAVQASPQPDAPITVTARWAETDGCLRVTVQDQGAGIAPDHLDRIFEPFFTTRREQGGTGLGLSISAEIIRAHQGRITAHSQHGQGACFTLDLPVHKEPPHDA